MKYLMYVDIVHVLYLRFQNSWMIFQKSMNLSTVISIQFTILQNEIHVVFIFKITLSSP